MRKIFLISLMLLLIGGLAASCASKMAEVPLISVFHAKEKEDIVVQIMHNKEIYTLWIKAAGIHVKIRDDGKDYTTITILSTLIGYEGVVYPGGTILVPYPEDVEKWNNWLNNIKLKKERPQIIPRRVLPPNSGKD